MIDWQKYYEDTKNNPPSKLLVEALGYVENKSEGLDLGSGPLVDSKYLLSQGFRVTAVDASPTPEQIKNEEFKFIKSTFRDYNFPIEKYDLVNAQFCLPFNGREGFDSLWKNIIDSLKYKGVFAGQLFGDHDQWVKPNSELIFHNRSQVENILDGLETIKLEEIEKDGKTSDGNPKHWHVFHIIFRKK